jgi:hypothetical protein
VEDGDWQEFFDYLEEIVNLPEQTWRERMQTVIDMAKACDAEDNLNEFLCWWEK